jgi:hypothetical protein
LRASVNANCQQAIMTSAEEDCGERQETVATCYLPRSERFMTGGAYCSQWDRKVVTDQVCVLLLLVSSGLPKMHENARDLVAPHLKEVNARCRVDSAAKQHGRFHSLDSECIRELYRE